MVTEWRATIDDASAPPNEMSNDVEGFVRRRSWERTSETDDDVQYELTAYLGVDPFGVVVVCWTAWVRERGIRRDYMASGTRVYSGLPVPGHELERVADIIRPMDVCRYSVWGTLLFEAPTR